MQTIYNKTEIEMKIHIKQYQNMKFLGVNLNNAYT